MPNRTLSLETATPDEIVEALLAMEGQRPGLAYDVGMLLYEKDASKEFPGPPWGWYPKDNPGPYDVRLLSFNRDRRSEAILRLKAVWLIYLSEAQHSINQLDNGIEVSMPLGLRPRDLWTARNMVEKLAEVGIMAKLVPDPEEPPTSHRRSMRGLSAGPIA